MDVYLLERELIIKVKEIRTSFVMRNPYDDTYCRYLKNKKKTDLDFILDK